MLPQICPTAHPFIFILPKTRLLCQQGARDIPNIRSPINTIWPRQSSRCVPGPSGIIQQSTEPVVRWAPGLLPVGRAILAISFSRHPHQMPKPSQLAISKGKKQQLNSEHPAKAKFPTSCLRLVPLTSWRNTILELLCP